MSKSNDAALAVFIACKAEIDAANHRIRSASDDHFFAGAENVHGCHITASADQAVPLKRIQDWLVHVC